MRARRWRAVAGVAALAACAIAAGGRSLAARAGGATEPPGAGTAAGANVAATYEVWVWLDHAAAASDLPPAVGDDVIATRALLDTDRPVNPALVEKVAATGARIRHVSRWLRAIAVDADSATLARLHALPGVVRLSQIRTGEIAGAPAAGRAPARAAASTPVGPPAARDAARLPPAPAGQPALASPPAAATPAARAAAVSAAAAPAAPAASARDSAFYGATWSALRELNIPVLHELGLRGAGTRIAIFDTGFFLDHESLQSRQVVAQRDFINRTGHAGAHPADPPNQRRHGTAVWSLVGGYREGRLVGGAYEAAFYLAKVKRAGPDTRADEDRWVAAAEWADSLGVHIINSSIGFRDGFTDRPQIPYGDLDGNTTATTRAADEAARRGILVIVASGSAGPSAGSLWAPADADSIITVGSVDRILPGRAAVPSYVSSRGPTADGRTKPELVARGANLTAASTFDAVSYEAGFTGSSFAAPFITASAALFRQAWPGLSIMAIRSALMLAGGDALRPNNVVGHGVPDVAGAIMLPEGIVLGAGAIASLDLQRALTTVLPTFRWETPLAWSPLRPFVFTVQVARDSGFQNIVYSDTVRDANVFTARRPLPPMERAWFRIAATSERTGVQRVSPPVPHFRMPNWVRLLTYDEPEPVFTDAIRPTLSWAPLAAPAPAGPFTYDVQVISVATGQVVQQMLGLTTSTVRVPDPLVPNLAYRWRVIARTRPMPGFPAGMSDAVESRAPFVVQSAEAPPATLLYRPFPNPFPQPVFSAHGTNLWFDIHEAGPVELHVYDLRGRLVRRMIPARPDCGEIRLAPGLYGRGGNTISTPAGPDCAFTSWDGRDEHGRTVSAGIYIFRLRAAGVTDVQRVLFQPPAF